MKLRRSSLVLFSAFVFVTAVSPAQSSVTPQPAGKVIIDTDIGDDIDDAFAVDLTLASRN
jgi:purine nucleosidase